MICLISHAHPNSQYYMFVYMFLNTRQPAVENDTHGGDIQLLEWSPALRLRRVNSLTILEQLRQKPPNALLPSIQHRFVALGAGPPAPSPGCDIGLREFSKRFGSRSLARWHGPFILFGEPLHHVLTLRQVVLLSQAYIFDGF